jgi:hypothetical protein
MGRWLWCLLHFLLTIVSSSPIPRIAICFFGLMRSLHYTKQSLQTHVFDILREHEVAFDVFVHTYNLNSISNSRSKEFNISLNTNEWRRLFPLRSAIDDNDLIESTVVEPLLPLLLRHGDPWREKNPHTSVRNLIKQFHSLRRVTELWTNSTTDYQLVLYLRPDVWYFNDLNMTDVWAALTLSSSSISSQFIFVPKFHSWGGVNDRFAFGPPQAMALYGSRILEAANYSLSKPIHPETFLRDLLDEHHIARSQTDILFERVRSNGVLWGVPVDEGLPEKSPTRYQLVRNVLGQWSAVAMERTNSSKQKKKKPRKKTRKRPSPSDESEKGSTRTVESVRA